MHHFTPSDCDDCVISEYPVTHILVIITLSGSIWISYEHSTRVVIQIRRSVDRHDNRSIFHDFSLHGFFVCATIISFSNISIFVYFVKFFRKTLFPTRRIKILIRLAFFLIKSKLLSKLGDQVRIPSVTALIVSRAPKSSAGRQEWAISVL